MRSRTVGCNADESYAYLVPVFVRVFLHLLLNVIVNYFPMQKVVELSNLLIYNVLLKLTFIFVPRLSTKILKWIFYSTSMQNAA